jgi:hypothetical protein
VVEVGPEAACSHVPAEIRIGRGNEFDIDRLRPDRPQASHLLFLDGGQQLALQRERYGIDFIQKQRSPGGGGHQAGSGASGIGKGPSLDAKQLCFQHGFRERRAIDRHKWPGGPRATVVYHTRYQPFPRTRLSLQQQRRDQGAPQRIEAGQVADLGAQCSHGRRGPHQAVGRVAGTEQQWLGHRQVSDVQGHAAPRPGG